MYAIKLKSLEWFEENAFLDHDGDYHPNEKDRDYYDKRHQMPMRDGKLYYKSVYRKNIRENIMYIRKYDEEQIHLYKWALEKVLYPETDPQYFI